MIYGPCWSILGSFVMTGFQNQPYPDFKKQIRQPCAACWIKLWRLFGLMDKNPPKPPPNTRQNTPSNCGRGVEGEGSAQNSFRQAGATVVRGLASGFAIMAYLAHLQVSWAILGPSKAPKWSQASPRWSQDCSKWPQDHPRWRHDGPRSPF